MFQKRWVKFDGFSISYYNNERVSTFIVFKDYFTLTKCTLGNFS